MSGFKFGAGVGTGSFNFGTTPATTTAAGFSFGTAPNPATTAPAAAPAATAQNQGFPFGQTAPAQPKSTGFGFGTPQVSAAPAPAPGQATGSFNFGVTPTGTSTATSTPVPGFNFGAAARPAGTGLLGQQATATPPAGFLGTQTAPTAAGALFSTQQAGTTAAGALFSTQQASTTAAGLNLSGLLGAQSTSAPTGFLGAQTMAATPGGGFVGAQTTTSTLAGLLGAAATMSSTGGAQATQPQTGFGYKLGGIPAATSTVPVSSTGPTLNLGLGPATTPLQVSSIAQPTPAAGGIKIGLGAATTSTTSILPGGLSTARAAPTTVSLSTTTTTSSSRPTAPTLNYRQLEEAINKWTLELEEQEKIFLQQATQVNAWDRLLIDNGEKITQLNTDVERVKIDQQRLDQELDFIHTQQKELEELLNPLEQAVEQLPPINYQQHADLEREHTYKLAENIDAQLKRMVQDLKEIIEHLNTNNSGQDNNDPVVQIAKILNAHMDSLQWVDQNTGVLQRRVDEVAKLVNLQKKEQEKNFRLAYE